MKLTVVRRATGDQGGIGGRLEAASQLVHHVNHAASIDEVGAAAVALLQRDLGYGVVMMCTVVRGELHVRQAVGMGGVGATLRPSRDVAMWASLPDHGHLVAEDFAADPWPELQMLAGCEISVGLSLLLVDDGAPVALLGAYRQGPPPSAEDVIFAGLVRGIVESAYWRHRQRRRHARAERLESVRRMAAGVSHDFASLLTVAALQADVLLEAGVPPAREEVVALKETLQQAGGLIEQLQSFIGFRGHTTKRVDPAAAIEQMRPMLRALAGPSVAVQIESDPTRCALAMAPDALQRIVTGLLRNAAEAVAHTGTVRIAVSSIVLPAAAAARLGLPPGPYVRITVTDDGCGMDEQTLASAVEPYFTTKQQGAEVGRGLGLSVVHGIVSDEGGALHLDSAPGRGTVASAYLPVARHLDDAQGAGI